MRSKNQIINILLILLLIGMIIFILVDGINRGKNAREKEIQEYKQKSQINYSNTLTTYEYNKLQRDRIKQIEESAKNRFKNYENKKLTKLGINSEIQHSVKGWSDNTGISQSLIYAIIEYESSFNPLQYTLGDYGLMQVNQVNVDYYTKFYQGNLDSYSIDDNIYMGCQILKNNYNKNDLHYTLMCYNMGKRKTDELRSKKVYTSEYSRKIISVMKKYQNILED